MQTTETGRQKQALERRVLERQAVTKQPANIASDGSLVLRVRLWLWACCPRPTHERSRSSHLGVSGRLKALMGHARVARNRWTRRARHMSILRCLPTITIAP